jgi:parallel beta-helix repeat protein
MDKKFLTILFFIIGIFCFTNNIYAAQCGPGSVPEKLTCECGDTVMGNYTLPADLTCTGHGLVVGANNITIDGDNHTIDGDDGSSDYGISNSGGYDNISVIDLNITDFARGIYFYGSVGTETQKIQNINVSSCAYGIYLYYLSNYNNLISNTVGSNTSAGIYLYYSSSNTLTSNTVSSNYNGIYLAESLSNTFTSNTINSNSNVGVSIQSSSSSNTLTSNTINSNNSYGVYISSSSNTLTSNTINSNSYGIYLPSSSSSNTLTSNTINSNAFFGIFLSYSSSNTLTGNIMTGNANNLYVDGAYDNTISTTNTVQGKPVYYFYNNDGTAEAPLIYDGNVIGDIGMFWCIGCDYVQVKNATLSIKNYIGVFFSSTTNSTIENITVNSNNYGIYLSSSSSSNTLTSNTINSSIYNGIYLVSSSSNTLTSNTINSNSYGIYLLSSSSNTLTGNILFDNRNDLYNTSTTNTYNSNQFNHNMTNKMFTFVESTRIYNVGDTISFNVSTFNASGSSCSGCATITTYPSETITPENTWASTNNPKGYFTANKSGIYSILFTVTDSNSNTTKRVLKYLVGDTQSKTTKYYYNRGLPTHGQPVGNGNDSQSLYLEAPENTVEWWCSDWVQNSPDELPNYPLSNLTDINIDTWYKQTMASGGYVGIQRYVIYNNTVNYSGSISAATDYTETNKSFDLSALGGDWMMDYSKNWYWLSMKLKGTNPYQTTFPSGYTPDDASYADFTYNYTTTPAVKSISNDDVNVLSATAPTTDTSNATIVLDYPLTGSASTNIVLGDPDNSHPYRRPFKDYTTVINSDGTVTLQATGITSSTTTINSVPMDITPNTGTVTVSSIATASEGYPTQWTESGTGATSAVHTISSLKPDTAYAVKVDNSMLNTYTSDGNGNVTFAYTGGYSTHVFDLSEESSAPLKVQSQPVSAAERQTNSLLLQIAQLKAKIAAILGNTTDTIITTTPLTPPPSTFTKDLRLGSVDNEVKLLQQYLNTHGFIVSQFGPGSPGNETQMFGYATRQALIKFQEAHADEILKPYYTKGTGNFGPLTRKWVNGK